jgi:hypothetical protein
MPKKILRGSGLLISKTALALLLFATATFFAFISFAATPSSGTLTETSGPITYTAGPFLVSNPTPQVGVSCDAPLQCDHYQLNVSVPASFANTHNVVITVSWPNPAEDYDIYLRQGAPPGTADIKSSASSSNPEVIVTDAVNGTYTIRTVPFAVAGGSTTTTIELREKPETPTPAPPGPSTPRYHNFAATGALGNSAGEPTLSAGRPLATQPGGRTMYIAGLETLRVTWNDCTSPASAPGFGDNNQVNPALTSPLWEDKSYITTSVTTLDPILFGDLQTNRIQVSQLGPKTSFLAYTDDDGETYTPTQGSPINPGVDHQTIGGGPYSPNLEPPHPTYPNAVYYASQDVAVAQLGRSDTGGLTYGPAVPMYNLTQCGGLHGHVKVTPRTSQTVANGHVGTVYVPNKGCAGAEAVVVSEDNGNTFAIRPIPGSAPGNNDPSVGIDAAGKIYVAMADNGMKVSVSSDKGVTWQTANPIDVGASFGIKNAVFPTAVGGDAGRATVMFLATSTGGDYQATGVFTGVWHIYAAHTFDGGNTWETVRVTPENDPVQRGSICTGGTTCGADRNLLDFNDMEIDHEGRVIMAYADGCVGCTSPTGADSRSAKATIARQSGGKRMRNVPGSQENAVAIAPAAPLMTSVARSTASTVRVEWATPDNGGSAITGYNVYRKTGANGTYARLGGAPTVAGKTTFDDTTATDNSAQYFYKVTAVNSAGEGINCGDFLVGEPVPLGSPCILPGLLKLGPDPDTGGTAPPGTAGPGMNMLTVHVAQPYNSNTADPIRLVFTITTDPNSTGTHPTGTAFYVSMNAPDGKVRGVRMAYKGTSNPGGPTFESYAARPSNAGTADGRFADGATLKPAEPTSNYDAANGKITIVVKASDLAVAPGQSLNGFNAAVTETTDFAGLGAGATATVDEVPNGLARSGENTFAVNANSACAPNSIPLARLQALSPTTGDAPLTVNFTAANSSDADAGDTLTYTFNFGDGSQPVTQSAPTISHTYRDAGNYKATLVVKDSKNATSTNPAEVVVQTALPLQGIVSRKVHGTSNTFDLNLPTDGPAAVEPRSGGANGNFTIIYTFDRDITAPGTANSNDPNGTATVQSGPASNQVTVNLTGISNAQNFEVELNNVEDQAGANLTGVKARMGVLLGDVNGTGSVDGNDVSAVQAKTRQTANSTNFRTDVNSTGRIDGNDVSLTQGSTRTRLP